MYGSATRAQNLNVQLGSTFGIGGSVTQDSVWVFRSKTPFWHVSNKTGRNEPKNRIVQTKGKTEQIFPLLR